ncbi:T9SS type A sorting domain-containing protein [Chryseobacterium takakiae]|uniref:Por secretion system C-terminal sorting domain-containing protein n=1 Tax=Chryseobacterium takakiae TaxID=1302685 RepID=A0A1M4UWU7_9FLAO|nr:T9SS type A sorting domain-containing protein [Chryseobacterium takakiae]SHE61184.1 Por secretion system C-terminal sorting domain-containing protein [Chryseobacterium takakiae]
MKKFLFMTCALMTQALSAQLLLNDDLSTLTTSQLSGQGSWTNSSSTNGGGACAGFGCTNTQVAAFSQSYSNYGSAINSARTIPNQDAVGRNFTPMAMPADGNTFYFSFLVNASTVPSTTPGDFIRVLSGGSSNTAIRILFQNATGGFRVGGSKNTGTNTYSTTVLPLNTTHLVVVKYTYNPGSTTDDVMSIYLNPSSAAEPGTADLTISSGNDYASTLNLDRFFIRTNTTSIPTSNITFFKAAKTYNELFSTVLGTSESLKSKKEVLILENPVNGSLKIKLPEYYNSKKTTVTVFDTAGRKVIAEDYSENINVSYLQKGFYTVEISDGKERFSSKLIKK